MGSGSYGAAGTGGTQGSTSGSTGGYGEGGFGNATSTNLGDKASELKDKAADKAADMKDTARDKAAQFKEKASEFKATLADKLEAGAEKLRSQQAGSYAGATGTGDTAISHDKLSQVNDKLAAGMQSTADFIRNADVENMKHGIEKQVKENPGRSLLIAAGIGYLLGKAFRK
jgi:ElaB/YqjD/DUF883 family membrane-anchored ribosome-binding protein